MGAALPPSAARAQDGTGFEAGLRLGYGIPFGKITDSAGDDLDEAISSAIPLRLDVGYRATREIFVGLFGQYGFGSVGDTVDATCGGVDCSATDTQIGFEAHYHFMPDAGTDPWLGLGAGWEWMGVSVSGPGGEVSIVSSGMQLIDLQGGLDYRMSEHFFLGSYLSFAVGRYGNVSTDCSGSAACSGFGVDGSIKNKAFHEWLTFGIRGGYTP